MEPGLSAQLGQMDPHSFTTVNAACFMSPAVLISYTLFNSSPYNIHFSKPGVTVKNCPWNERRAVVLWRVEISGKCGVVLFSLHLSLEVRVRLQKFESPGEMYFQSYA